MEKEHIIGQATLGEGTEPEFELSRWLDQIQLQSETGRRDRCTRIPDTTPDIRPGGGRPNNGISHLVRERRTVPATRRPRSSSGRPKTTTRAIIDTNIGITTPESINPTTGTATTREEVDQTLLLKVLSNPEVRSLKTVPKALRREVAIVQSSIMQGMISKPSDEQAWIEWFIFPRIVLVTMPDSEHYKLRRKKT